MLYPGDSDRFSRLQQNSRDAEFERAPDVQVVLGLLSQAGDLFNVLEIGAGIGRGSVHVGRVFDYTTFWLLDGEGEKQHAGVNDTLTNDTFYSNHQAAFEFCEANGLAGRHRHLDAGDLDAAFETIAKAGVRFDAAFSLRAVGFHWPMAPMLDWLAKVVEPCGILVFESRPLERCGYPEHAHGRWKHGQRLACDDMGALAAHDLWTLLDYHQEVVGGCMRAYTAARRVG